MDYKDLYKQYCDELLDYYKSGQIQVKCQEGDEKKPFEGLEGVADAIEVREPNYWVYSIPTFSCL